MKARIALFLFTLALLSVIALDMVKNTHPGLSWMVTFILGVVGIAALCGVLHPFRGQTAAA